MSQELKKSHEREISEPEYFLPGRVKAGCVSCFEVRFSQELWSNYVTIDMLVFIL